MRYVGQSPGTLSDWQDLFIIVTISVSPSSTVEIYRHDTSKIDGFGRSKLWIGAKHDEDWRAGVSMYIFLLKLYLSYCNLPRNFFL